MKKVSLLLGLLICSITTLLAQNVQWAKNYGSTGNDIGTSITTDASGFVYTTGWFRSSMTVGGTTLVSKGGDDVFVMKTDSDGVLQWIFSNGGTGEDRGYGIKVDASGNIYITGHFSGTDSFSSSNVLVSKGLTDVFVAKYNASGTLQWASAAGSTSADRVNGMTMDAAGNIYITGWYGNIGGGPGGGGNVTASFGSSNITTIGQQDGYAAAINNSGTWQWATTLGGRMRDIALDIQMINNNFIGIAGTYSDTMNLNGATLRSNGATDAFFATLSTSGAKVNGLGVGGRQGDNGYAVGRDAGGNLYLCGNFTGTTVVNGVTLTANGTASDAFLISLDPSYNFRWVKSFGGSGAETPSKISSDALGNIYIGGNTASATMAIGSASITGKGGNDGFVIQMDSNGNANWISQIGGTNNDDVRQVAVDKENQYVTGSFNTQGAASGTASVGTMTLTALDSADAFIYKIFVCPGLSQKLTFSGPTDFCTGDSVVVSASVSAATWLWLQNGTAITGATSSTLVIKTAGTYYCEMTGGNGCKMNSNSVTVNVGTPPNASISSTGSQICSGDSVLLTAGSGFGYSFRFYRNDTAVTSWVTSSFYYAKVAGIYKVEVNNFGCMSMSDTVGLSIIMTQPVTITASGSTTICPGDTVILNSDTNTGWTYYWTRNGQIINNSIQPTLIVTQAGQYRVVVGMPNGCNVSSNIITINSPNGASQPTLTGFPGTLPLCYGDSARLVMNTGGGPPNPNATYQWYLNNTPITGATTRFYTVKSNGTYKGSVTAGGCTSYTKDTTFTFVNGNADVNPKGNAALCQGNKLTLTATGDAGSTFQWYNNGVAITGATNSTYDATMAGTYYVEVSLGRCKWTSPNIIATSVPGPATPTIVQSTNQLACSITANSYQWYFNSAPIANSNSQFIYGWQTGFYQVEIFDANGCSARSPLYSFTNNGIEEAKNFSFKAYPNPASQLINLDMPNGVSRISLYDMHGRMVLTQSHQNQGNVATIDVQSLPEGLYMIRVEKAGEAAHLMIQVAH